MLSESDIAYIAGLFDGEGSIHIKRGIENKKKHTGKARAVEYLTLCVLVWRLP